MGFLLFFVIQVGVVAGKVQDFNQVQFLIINQMKEQLQRIRSKDFSSIDDKLFQNLSRADNLTSTISQLSEFQKFLLEQINSLNHDPNTASSNIIAKSIAKNFDGLKDSLLRCSKIQEKAERTDKKAILTLKTQVDQLKRGMNELQSQVKRIMKVNFTQNTSLFECYSKSMIQKLSLEKTKINQIQQAFKLVEAENIKLKAENESLKKSKQAAQHSQQNISVPLILQKHQGRQRKPLEQYLYNAMNEGYKLKDDSSWKTPKEQISHYVATESDKRCSSLKRQTSNHEISRKNNIYILKQQQSQLLRGKGVQAEQLRRGKSKQKLKLASMF